MPPLPSISGSAVYMRISKQRESGRDILGEFHRQVARRPAGRRRVVLGEGQAAEREADHRGERCCPHFPSPFRMVAGVRAACTES